MSGIITQGAFPKNKRPGVFAFTQLEYKQHPQYWRECFYVAQSKSMYEEATAGNTFGLVPPKTEGGNIQYASESQAHTTRSTHVVYAMGYIITFEEALNDLYEKLGKRRGARLTRSFARTKETVHFNLFNRAFNATYTFGDAKELCATDHPTLYGDQSNELAVAADLTEQSLEDINVDIRRAVDNVGNPIALRAAKLLYAPEEAFNATRILESAQRSGTANNDTNAIKSLGTIPEHMDSPFLDDADAWFVLTDIAKTEEGLVHFERYPFQMDMDNDSDNLNEKHFGYEYYSRTCFDFRAVYGSPGA